MSRFIEGYSDSMNARSDQFYDDTQPNLQEVLDRAFQNGEIPVSRVPSTRAAVAAFTRLMQRPAAELPANQGFIIQQIRRLRRQPTGLSAKTLSNTRSALLYVVRSGGWRSSRSALALTEEWQVLRTGLNRGPKWWSLSRLAGFSSRRDVPPSKVKDPHFQEFIDALQRSGEVTDALGHARRVTRLWNKLAADCPTLRLAPLTLTPPTRNRWTFPETAFPSEFRADVDAWFQHATSEDPFSPRASRALRPSTVRTRRHQLFKTASALVFSGRPIETVRTLADLVTAEAFQSALRHLLARQDGRSTEALHGLAAGLLAVARHHVRVEPETEARLARIVKNLDVGATGFRSRTRTRLAAFEDDRRVSTLLQLPARLLAEAKAARPGRRRTLLAELAVAIEILTFAPMRVANLASLRVGVSVRRLVLRRETRWLITIPASEVKNGTELSYELPRDNLVDQALALYEQPDGWVFPGRGSAPKPASLLSRQIKRLVEERIGVAFHTHMFRALAGYLHLRENPNGFEAVRALLGNRDDQVIRNNYAFLAERSLIGAAQASIDRTRARLASLPKHSKDGL
jgi:integrase